MISDKWLRQPSDAPSRIFTLFIHFLLLHVQKKQGTDLLTDRLMDTDSYRDARTHLKSIGVRDGINRRFGISHCSSSKCSQNRADRLIDGESHPVIEMPDVYKNYLTFKRLFLVVFLVFLFAYNSNKQHWRQIFLDPMLHCHMIENG